MSRNCISFGETKLSNEFLEDLEKDLQNYKWTHLSILEIHPKSDLYLNLIDNVKKTLREFLQVPDSYQIVLLQADSTAMQAAIPLNLIGRSGAADYVMTGKCSEKAANEAKKYGEVNYATPLRDGYYNVPRIGKWDLSMKSAYIHIVTSECCNGLEFSCIPKIQGLIPLVGNVSHNLVNKPIDIKKFGLIYSTSSKICGIPGVTVVIVRDDLLGHALEITPSYLDFTLNSKNNTVTQCPVFTLYALDKHMNWLKKEHANVEGLRKSLQEKSKIIYQVIDGSGGFYIPLVVEECRSDSYIVFRIGGALGNEHTENKFIETAFHRGFFYLKGCSGGIQISLNHSTTLGETKTLSKFMQDFYEANK